MPIVVQLCPIVTIVNKSPFLHWGNIYGAYEMSNNILCDLTDFGLIQVSGSDAQTFLQGQFSNDVGEVSETQSQLSSYNSPKGRMYASFRLCKLADSYLMLLPRENIEPTLKRLRMFVLRSDVKLEDVSDNFSILGVAGDECAAALKALFNEVPTDIDATQSWDNGVLVKIPGRVNRFQIISNKAAADAYRTSLGSKLEMASADTWKLLDIEAGIPHIYISTREEFVPQMVNLHSIGGVSFKKGCYPGQEIVARMHYLGKLKKRMYRIHVDGDACPQPNTNLLEPGKDQSVGQIVDAVADPNGGFEALAVLQIKSAEAGELCLENLGGSVRIEDLPYEVTNEA